MSSDSSGTRSFVDKFISKIIGVTSDIVELNPKIIEYTGKVVLVPSYNAIIRISDTYKLFFGEKKEHDENNYLK